MKTLASNQNQVYLQSEIINFYLQNYEKFLRYALKICNKKNMAEDVMQDVFVSIFVREDIKVTKLDQFITRAVKFNTLKKLKKNSLFTSGDQFNNNNQFFQNNSNHYDFLAEKIILTEIDKLPKRRKQIFLMKRFQKNSTKDVSMQLNISKKTVENHLTLAVKQLKSKLNYLK